MLLEDISTVRMDKIRKNIHTMSAESMGSSMERPMGVVDVSGIGAGEMAAIKPFLERAFEDHLRLVRTGTGSIDKQRVDEGGSAERLNPNLSRPARRTQSRATRNNQQLDQDNIEEDDDLLEPTADEESNVSVSRLPVRRYRT